MRRFAAAALLLFFVTACRSPVGSMHVVAPTSYPPLAETVEPPVYLTPLSQRYRVAVLSFIDQTGRADLISEPIADVLTTSLYDTNRFNLYDRQDLKRNERAIREVVVRDEEGEPEENRSDDPLEQYRTITSNIRVDGILTGYVTAIDVDKKGSGVFEADYRIVSPGTQLVVFSDNARVRFSFDTDGSSVRLNREDVDKLAFDISRNFVDLDLLARKSVVVTDITPDGSSVKVTLNVGSVENNIKQGFAGFVVEEDRRTRVERYLAKFVIVNVFPEASIGVVVPHCNTVGRCLEQDFVSPAEQIRSVRIGSRVRLK